MNSVRELNERIQQEATFVNDILAEVGKVIVGQERLIDRLLIALLSNRHLLIEGVPGLAKTLLVSSIAQIFHLKFRRIQFTPDLMPADIIGTSIMNADETVRLPAIWTRKPNSFAKNLPPYGPRWEK